MKYIEIDCIHMPSERLTTRFCSLYQESVTILAKITQGTFKGDNNYYLLTLFKPIKEKKNKLLNNYNQFKNKRGY